MLNALPTASPLKDTHLVIKCMRACASLIKQVSLRESSAPGLLLKQAEAKKQRKDIQDKSRDRHSSLQITVDMKR